MHNVMLRGAVVVTTVGRYPPHELLLDLHSPAFVYFVVLTALHGFTLE